VYDGYGSIQPAVFSPAAQLKTLCAISDVNRDMDVKDLFAWGQIGNSLTLSFIIMVLIAGCSMERRLPQSVLDDLSTTAEEFNDQLRGWSGSYLDDVSEVDVIQALSPTQNLLNEQLPHIDEFWCVTLELAGLRNGEPSSYEIDWFAILNEGSSEWHLIPRQIVAYPYEYDLLCEGTVP
jgi:hypothetical protein